MNNVYWRRVCGHVWRGIGLFSLSCALLSKQASFQELLMLWIQWSVYPAEAGPRTLHYHHGFSFMYVNPLGKLLPTLTCLVPQAPRVPSPPMFPTILSFLQAHSLWLSSPTILPAAHACAFLRQVPSSHRNRNPN